MRVLITTTPAAGHYLPVVPFGRALLDAGHEVLVCVRGQGASALRAEGFDVHVLADPDLDERKAIFRALPDLSSEAANGTVVGEVYAGLDAPAALPGIHAAIDRFAPDVVLSESCEFGGPRAALERAIPFVRASIMLAATEARFLPHAARFVPSAVFYAPRFALAPPLLDPGERALRFAERAPVERRPELPPLVLLTLGSVAAGVPGLFPGVYRAAIEQIAPLPVRLLVTTGQAADPAELGELPPNVRVERWVPLAQTLAEAALVVHHGGFGTTRATACAGVPAAVLPMFADQPFNARRIADLRAGIAVESVEQLRGAVARILSDPTYEVAAKRVRLDAARLPPIGSSVDALALVAQLGSAGALSSAA